MEKASPCLCLHSGPILQAILLQAVEKWTTEWNVSHSVRNVNKMCFYALCWLSNHIALDKKSDILLVRQCRNKWERRETERAFDGKLCQKHLYQNLYLYLYLFVSKSDNWFSSYSRKCWGYFLRHSVQCQTYLQINVITWQSKGQ